MSAKEHIQSLLKEAEIYRSQGLFDQSKEKYIEILEYIEKNKVALKDNKIIDAIKEKIREVDEKLTEIEESTDTPELAQEVQSLISNLFSFSKNKDTAAIEGAVAMAKFGQYEKALEEFEMLINEGALPLMAAMNMLRCHLSLATPEAAITQFKRWVSRDELGQGDLRYLRNFISDQLEKRGIKTELPQVGEIISGEKKTEEVDEGVLDLSSIGIELESGPRQGDMVEFDVTFQSGNTVSVIIPSKQKDMADLFKPGSQLSKVQCCSALAVFNSCGQVAGISKIESGPNRGNYSLDITITEE
ncbi:MAG: hypothetical protein JRC68_00890 [Deltaproteobacteria bacterium]|nr:hypothetical protein [Deltaproteobacteria bacterium]